MGIKIPADIVTFEDSAGNVISNDPRYHALKTLEDSGISFADSQPETLAAKAAEKAQAGVENTSSAKSGPENYEDVKGKDLGKLAKDREIEIKGLKASQVRAALMAQDADKAAQAEVNKANQTDEDEEMEDEEEDENSSNGSSNE